jgi:TolB-like protein
LGDVDRSALRTLPRRGYMLAISGNQIAGPGRSIVVALEPPDPREPSPPSAMPHLSIVVLPFANLGGDPEQEYFADGVTDSLTTDFSRIAGAFVIGRNTAFTFKGKAVDVREIGRELSVRYVVEGSVQRGGTACA